MSRLLIMTTIIFQTMLKPKLFSEIPLILSILLFNYDIIVLARVILSFFSSVAASGEYNVFKISIISFLMLMPLIMLILFYILSY